MNAVLSWNKGSAPYPLRYRRTKPVSRSGIHSALRCSRRRGKESLLAWALLQPDRALYQPRSCTLALTTLFSQPEAGPGV